MNDKYQNKSSVSYASNRETLVLQPNTSKNGYVRVSKSSKKRIRSAIKHNLVIRNLVMK